MKYKAEHFDLDGVKANLICFFYFVVGDVVLML